MTAFNVLAASSYCAETLMYLGAGTTRGLGFAMGSAVWGFGASDAGMSRGLKS